MTDSRLQIAMNEAACLNVEVLALQAKIEVLEMVIDKHYLLSEIENACNGQWKRYTFVRFGLGNRRNSYSTVVDELIADQMIELVEYKDGIQYLTITDKGKQYKQELEQEAILE